MLLNSNCTSVWLKCLWAFNLRFRVRDGDKKPAHLSLRLFDAGADSPCCLLQFTGVILLAIGVWGKVSLEAYFSLASEESTNAPYVLIGTGAIIVIFGLFGCFATCRGSPWMLKLVSKGAASSPKYSLQMWPCMTVILLMLPSVRHVFDLSVPGWTRGRRLGLYLQTWGELLFKTLTYIFFKWITVVHKNILSTLFWLHQIKAKLGVAYEKAVKTYNSTDSSSSSSIAVDTIQRTVSGRVSITLIVSLLSDFVCVSLYKLNNSCL